METKDMDVYGSALPLSVAHGVHKVWHSRKSMLLLSLAHTGKKKKWWGGEKESPCFNGENILNEEIKWKNSGRVYIMIRK